MKKLSLLLLLIIMTLGYSLSAQVAINSDGSTPDNSAMLDVKGSNKGMLVPRMTLNQIQDISSPANGLLVFNTDENRFYFFDSGAGFKWQGHCLILMGFQNGISNKNSLKHLEI